LFILPADEDVALGQGQVDRVAQHPPEADVQDRDVGAGAQLGRGEQAVDEGVAGVGEAAVAQGVGVEPPKRTGIY
jgi:hypothetical protein